MSDQCMGHSATDPNPPSNILQTSVLVTPPLTSIQRHTSRYLSQTNVFVSPPLITTQRQATGHLKVGTVYGSAHH